MPAVSEQPARVPPEELEEWVAEVKRLLDLDDTVEIAAVLDLAKDYAHNVARPAAPLTTYALGVAVGRSGGDPAEEFSRLGELLRERALSWRTEETG